MSKSRAYKGFAGTSALNDKYSAYHELEDDYKQGKRKRRLFFHRVKQCVFENFCVDWQLYRGEEKYPRILNMTTRAASLENIKYKKQFIARLDRGDDSARLWSWRPVEKMAVDKAIKALFDRYSGTVSTADERVAYLLKYSEGHR